MRELEKLIADWRRATRARMGDEAAEELEDHLRERIGALARGGMSEPVAFDTAVKELGSPGAISAEFEKMNGTWWPMKAAFVCVAITAILATIGWVRFSGKPLGWLLGPHVFAVTLGYVSALLIGAAGMCFVAQRSFGEFSPGRLKRIGRQAGTLAGVAAVMTALGIGFGMVWADLTWGRVWAWDAKETGAFSILVFLAVCFAAERTGWWSGRGMMLAGVAGNVVVLLGWFGANMAPPATAGMFARTLLMVVVGAHVVVFIVGWLPAGWMRSGSRKCAD